MAVRGRAEESRGLIARLGEANAPPRARKQPKASEKEKRREKSTAPAASVSFARASGQKTRRVEEEALLPPEIPPQHGVDGGGRQTEEQDVKEPFRSLVRKYARKEGAEGKEQRFEKERNA